jgi:glycogen synthase kinase 3 beta
VSLEVIREKVQDGLTGETREITYTQCKIVGNGSFGVVFQTKLAPSNEDAAIKRVLQDKRFKVCISVFALVVPKLTALIFTEP